LPGGLRVLAVHESPPLSQMLQAINKPSQNLHAEMMLRLLGARVRGRGTPQLGLEAVDDFLKRARVATASWSLEDGSGLARTDMVTPHGMVDLLAAMDRHPHRTAFISRCPSRVDGTLAGAGNAGGRAHPRRTGTWRNERAHRLRHHARRRPPGLHRAQPPPAATSGVGAIDEIAAALVR
jgi:D-alanyl-D-alanine carboxypeptidase/D-alanyl-D-alanine-endopeptidase (penicillin-binding protein 4)